MQTTDGRDATDLFAVSTKVEGLNANDRWDIAASGSGQATALYVPAKEAAPTEPVDYLFGGTVTYRDVDTDIQGLDFDVFAKGPDQSHAGFQRAEAWCRAHGKEVVVIPRTENISSTLLKSYSKL